MRLDFCGGVGDEQFGGCSILNLYSGMTQIGGPGHGGSMAVNPRSGPKTSMTMNASWEPAEVRRLLTI